MFYENSLMCLWSKWGECEWIERIVCESQVKWKGLGVNGYWNGSKMPEMALPYTGTSSETLSMKIAGNSIPITMIVKNRAKLNVSARFAFE